jgi:hypothetical protein
MISYKHVDAIIFAQQPEMGRAPPGLQMRSPPSKGRASFQ